MGYDRGSRASLHVADIDEKFRAACAEAEARHRTEIAGWRVLQSSAQTPTARSTRSSHQHLYDIRALATRQY
jgi:hypothetical protein